MIDNSCTSGVTEVVSDESKATQVFQSQESSLEAAIILTQVHLAIKLVF